MLFRSVNAPVTFALEPSNTSACANNDYQCNNPQNWPYFVAVLENVGGPYTYRWQQSTDYGTNWSFINNNPAGSYSIVDDPFIGYPGTATFACESNVWGTGNRGSVLLVKPDYRFTNYMYRLQAANACGSYTTRGGILTINPGMTVTQHPISQTVCEVYQPYSNGNAFFTAQVAGYNPPSCPMT